MDEGGEQTSSYFSSCNTTQKQEHHKSWLQVLIFLFFLMYFFISLATCFDWSSSSELKYLLFQRRMPLWTLFWMVQGVGLAFASVSITSYYNRLQEQCQPASTFWWDVYCVLNLLHSNWQNEWCECSVFFRIKLFLGCTADIYFILLIYM